MKNTLLFVVLLIALGCTKEKSESKDQPAQSYQWRLVMSIPKTLPIWGPGVERFAKRVESVTEGRMKIKVYGAGELVPALEVFDAVKAGQVEMAHSAAYYWQGKLPAAPYFTSVPFGLNANGMRAWLKSGGGQELWDELYKPHGIKSFPAGNTGLQMGGWFNKEINTPADYKGLKMRIPGLGGKVIAKLGGNPMLVPGGEIYTNLSTGVIDATEWVGPYHDYNMGFHKAAKYYYYPGWHEPGPVLELMVSLKKWNELPESLKTAIEACAAEMDRDIYAEWLEKDSLFLEKIRNETSIEFRQFPSEVLAQLRKSAEEVKAEVASSSDLARRIHESYSNFQKQYEKHQNVTEHSYNLILNGSH